MQCQINHLKLVQFSGKDTFSNNFQDMWFNKKKKKKSSLVHTWLSWNYLPEVTAWFIFSTWSLPLFFLYEYIIAYYWPYVSTCIWYPGCEQTRNVSLDGKQRPLRQMNLPEQRQDALFWNSTQSWNQSTWDVIYQNSLKVTIFNSENHPREGFRISKCFWDCSRKQCRRKHHL